MQQQELPGDGGQPQSRGGGSLPNKVASYLRDFSVAAVDAFREGDVSELSHEHGSEQHHDGDMVAPEAAPDAVSDRASSVKFAKQLASNLEIDAGAESFNENAEQ